MGLGTVYASALPMATGGLFAKSLLDLAVPFFHSHCVSPCVSVKKCLPEAACIQVCCYSRFFSNQLKVSFIFGTDEETYIFAAIGQSFLCSRAHAAAQKRQSEIHFPQAVLPAENPPPAGGALAQPVPAVPERWIFKARLESFFGRTFLMIEKGAIVSKTTVFTAVSKKPFFRGG
ncbi:MAG: hypothetical protein FWF49_03395 [Oscillospiraceae bacterium]|nr:hypothetical protein [Oscillospiraceae bacterium]